MKMNKNIRFLWLLVMTLPLVALINIETVHSATTRVYLDPDIVYVSPGESFTVDIKVADVPAVTPLYSWQVYISFNSSVLQCLNVTEGDFLIEQPEGTIGTRQIRTAWALFGWSTKGKYSGVPGSGTLATIEFNVVGTGESVLNITNSLTYLLELRPPPVPPGESPLKDIPFTPENGFFTNIAVPPTASFTYSPSHPGIEETITFDASASDDPDGTVVRYDWDFGDGESANNMTVATVTHAYEAAGTYTVTLKVLDDTELYGTSTKAITVRSGHNVAVAKVETSATNVKAGESVLIEVTVLNDGTEPESFDVKVYYGDNLLDTQHVTGLAPGTNTTLTFTWDTSGVAAEVSYAIRAEATEVEGETNLGDNTRGGGTVRVGAPEPSFPTTLVIAAVVVVVVVAVGVFLYMRRR